MKGQVPELLISSPLPVRMTSLSLEAIIDEEGLTGVMKEKPSTNVSAGEQPEVQL